MANTNRENICVVVRFRPSSLKEEKNESSLDQRLEVDTICNTVSIAQTNTRFIFDHVFDHTSEQKFIFEKVAKHAVDWVAEGYNTTIFTYGSTGTGKTFTMFGNKGEQRGIIPRTCDHLFHTINNNKEVLDASVRCSFLEIYQENIRDLLADNKEYVPSLRIRQHQTRGMYVQGIIEKHVYTPQEILTTIAEGAAQRSTASTALNSTSSRSHAVLTLLITQRISDGTEINSKIHLIDLAGSENVERSQVVGTNLLEAQMINKSLSALGNVICALTEKGREHVPYRDSRLTHLLQDSLGGNSKTILITTASLSPEAYSETLNTLKFAKRAKEIKNIPTVNRNESNANLVKTVALLTRQLAELQSKYEDAKAVVDKVEQAEQVDSKTVIALKTKVEQLERKIQANITEQEAGAKRREQYLQIFDKQRELAQAAATQLYYEKLKVCSLTTELEQYKMFYDSLKDIVETGNTSILEIMVKNAKITRPLSIDTDLAKNTMPQVEVDSP